MNGWRGTTWPWAAAIAAGMLLGVTFFFQVRAEAAKAEIVVGGAGPGSSAHRLAAGLAEAVNRTSKTVSVTNRSTKGFVANMRLIASKRMDLAMTNGIFVDFIQRKKGPYAKDAKPAKNIRGVGPVATTWMQVLTLQKTGIKSVNDLVGKRVNMGPRGSATLYLMKFITDAMGITDKINKEYLNWGDAVKSMGDGKIQAISNPGSMPTPAGLEASRMSPVRVLDIPEKARDAYIAVSRGYYKTTKDASAYKGMEGKSFKTVAYTILVITHDKLPNDVIYEVTRQTYEPKNQKFLTNIMKSWAGGLENAKSGAFLEYMKLFTLKLHPGAARYWKERGFSVPVN